MKMFILLKIHWLLPVVLNDKFLSENIFDRFSLMDSSPNLIFCFKDIKFKSRNNNQFYFFVKLYVKENGGRINNRVQQMIVGFMWAADCCHLHVFLFSRSAGPYSLRKAQGLWWREWTWCKSFFSAFRSLSYLRFLHWLWFLCSSRYSCWSLPFDFLITSRSCWLCHWFIQPPLWCSLCANYVREFVY